MPRRAANPVRRLVRITSVSHQPRPVAPRRSARARLRRTGAGVILGIVTAVVALGVAQLAAGAFNVPLGAPVDAVGELSINHTPPWLKNFAIREFGSSDKTVLVWGIRAVLIVFAAVIGIIALRALWQGLVGLAIFSAIGVYAALSQPTANAGYAWPTLAGAVVGAVALRYLTRLALAALRPAPAWPTAARPAAAAPSAGQDAAEPPSAPPAAKPGEQTASEQTASEQASPGPTPTGTPPPWFPGQGATQPGARSTWASTPPPWFPGQRGAQRPVASAAPDRRKFLLASTGAAGAAVVGYAVGSWFDDSRAVSDVRSTLKLPAAAKLAPPLPAGASLKVPGISPFITPNADFYRVDTAIILPEILPANWQLRVHGMVRREITLSFDQLIRRPLIEDYITLCCVSNPVGGPYIGNAKWLGASLRSLLLEAGIQPGADQLLCTSSDGFTSGTPVVTAMDGRDALLAVAMNDTALPVEHGFPVRLVIPGLYGYVSACKWLVDIEVTTYAANAAYWASRGWSQQAPIKTESRIDVPTGINSLKAGSRTAIAGEAWAQHKGIEAVEVRIGGGPWYEAQLAAVPDIDTWRQWVYYWDTDVPPGPYLIEARATDRTGYTQTAVQAPPEPNGATGYPSVSVNVVS